MLVSLVQESSSSCGIMRSSRQAAFKSQLVKSETITAPTRGSTMEETAAGQVRRTKSREPAASLPTNQLDHEELQVASGLNKEARISLDEANEPALSGATTTGSREKEEEQEENEAHNQASIYGPADKSGSRKAQKRASEELGGAKSELEVERERQRRQLDRRHQQQQQRCSPESTPQRRPSSIRGERCSCSCKSAPNLARSVEWIGDGEASCDVSGGGGAEMMLVMNKSSCPWCSSRKSHSISGKDSSCVEESCRVCCTCCCGFSLPGEHNNHANKQPHREEQEINLDQRPA